MAKVRAVLRFIARNTWRVTVSVVGFAMLVAGAVMMVTPGPGLLVIIAGLAVLATQYAWAERALDAARERAAKAKEAALRKGRRQGATPGPPGTSAGDGSSLGGDGQPAEPPPALGGPEESDAERERS